MTNDAPKATPAMDERKKLHRLYGAILQKLRDEKGHTQETAAEAADPPMTPQNWARYEGGQAASIVDPVVRRRFLSAVGATEEEFQAELANPRPPSPSRSRVARLAKAFEDVGQPVASLSTELRQAVFPLSEGDVTLTYPADLSPAGIAELRDYIEIFMRSRAKATTDA